MRQDQYVIKNAYNQPVHCLNPIKTFNSIDLTDEVVVREDGTVEDKSLLSLTNPKHVSALLCNYLKLKESFYGKFYTDGYFLM